MFLKNIINWESKEKYFYHLFTNNFEVFCFLWFRTRISDSKKIFLCKCSTFHSACLNQVKATSTGVAAQVQCVCSQKQDNWNTWWYFSW